ncbi:MAG: histidinol-phosphatase [Deltaproteobacteria bacterium]|nr:histidinol-phosphatase [Deltaproteobacteria bacterium]
MPDATADIPIITTIDRHVHTKLCHHASGEMEDYVLAAIQQDLEGLIFLEHMEEGINGNEKTWLTEEDFDSYFSEGKRLQEKYKSQLTIGLGVECGYNPDRQQTLVSRLDRRNWDEIGISCHFIKSANEHINLFSRKEDNLKRARESGSEQLLDAYFDTLHEAVATLPGTKVCHLDGALRFLPEIYLTDNHLEKIDQLLLTVKTKGMALEINTSGLVIRGEQFPSRAILKMAISYEIPLVVGSDAHMPEQVGRHFNQIKALIEKL